MEKQYLNAEGADSSQSSQTPVECGIDARCAGYATIPRTPLLEEKKTQEAGRRVIAAAAASMTHALPICDLRETSADSAFCFYLPPLMGNIASYSTVTLLARLRGWSMSHPRSRAM